MPIAEDESETLRTTLENLLTSTNNLIEEAEMLNSMDP
jgi:hypothetical protein